jgi:hypothetical protein
MVLIKTFVALGQDEPAVWKSRYPFYLRKVVEAPRNDIFMQHALKQLAAADLPIVLKAIIRWLKTKDNESSKTIKLSAASSSELIKRNNVSFYFHHNRGWPTDRPFFFIRSLISPMHSSTSTSPRSSWTNLFIA